MGVKLMTHTKWKEEKKGNSESAEGEGWRSVLSAKRTQFSDTDHNTSMTTFLNSSVVGTFMNKVHYLENNMEKLNAIFIFLQGGKMCYFIWVFTGNRSKKIKSLGLENFLAGKNSAWVNSFYSIKFFFVIFLF